MRAYLTAVSALALCFGLAACADFPQPQYPVSQPTGPAPQAAPESAAPAPAPAAAPAEDNGPQARPTTGVQQSTLPPPPGAKAAPPRPAGRPGALLDRSPDAGRPMLMRADWRAGEDEVLVYPAARRKSRAKAAAAKAEPAESAVTVHKGDTLQAIAKAHGTTIEALARLNGLKSPYRLTAGKTIKLPAEAADPEEPAPKATARRGEGERAESAAPKAAETVTVAKGDTLAAIARKSGVSIEDLARLNGLKKPYPLKPGQTLQLRAAEPAPAEEPPARSGTKARGGRAAAAEEAAESSASTSTITVRRRDTLQSLARDAGVSVETLARLNHLRKPYRVKPGQQIKLPDQPAAESGRARPEPREAPAAPRSVKVGRGDTLQSIARKEGVSVEALAKLNRLKKPYRLKRGQTIRLPAREAEAASSSYTVQAGDSLYSIARRFGAEVKSLAEANGMEVGDPLMAGRRIRLPNGAEDRIAPRPSAPEPAPRAAPEPPARRAEPEAPRRTVPTDATPARPAPYSALPPNPPVAPAPGLAPPPSPPPAASQPSAALPPYRPTAPAPESAPATDADVAAAGRGLFLWPVRGDVLQRFGPIAGGQRNDGVDIAGIAGDRVVAAAAGEVVYAGNSVPGFGNLVLIRHEGGWVTAYAHLRSLDVKMRQMVTQGQSIGQVGQTGGVSQPQLHFEVRYAPSAKDKARPIDPMLVLPQ